MQQNTRKGKKRKGKRMFYKQIAPHQMSFVTATKQLVQKAVVFFKKKLHV
jgi:hypothetical protein